MRLAAPSHHAVREGALVLAGLLCGVALAAASAFSPLLPVIAVAGALAAAVAIRRPYLPALTAALLMLALPRPLLFDLTLPLGPVAPTDLLLALAVAGYSLRRVMRRKHESALDPVLVRLVLLFQAAALVALVTAQVNGIPLTRSLSELRIVLAYALVLPLGAYLARHDLRRVAVLSLSAGVVGSSFVIVNYLLGRGSLATYTSGVLRVEGFFAPLLTLVVALGLLGVARSGRDKLLLLAVSGLAGAALLFTFQRGAWLAALAGVAVLYILLPWSGRRRLLLLLPLAVVVGALTAALVNQQSSVGSDALFSSVGTRFSSVGDVSTDVSSQHRLAEFEEGASVVRERPWTGIGLGGAISFVSPLYSSAYNTSGVQATAVYLHSSWLWVAVKMGLPALALLVLLLVRALVLGVRARAGRAGVDPLALVVLAVLTTLGVLALSGPHFTSDDSSAVVALVLAGASAAAARHKQRVASAGGSHG